jgi:murein DD-endopeptidase MepM/ murein hydrolase activator NlpD
MKKVIFIIFYLLFFNINFNELIISKPLFKILKAQTLLVQSKENLINSSFNNWCYDFLNDLKYGQKGEEIKALQIALKKENLFQKSINGYFDYSTFKAVKLFQEKYKKEILIPWGFKKSTGFVGIATRTKLNDLYGCTKIYNSSLFLQQGDTLIIKIKTSLLPEKIEGDLNSKKINFFKIGDNLIGIIGISVKEKPGRYDLVINLDNKILWKKKINIIERKFLITKLEVTEELKEKGFTPSKIKKGVVQENASLNEVFKIFTPQAYFNDYFIYPLEKVKDVGSFGNIRKSGEATIQHLGVDLEAAEGTPVYAVNNGIVRFAKELDNYGKTVVIDHGLGIFSLYLHLSEFKTFEGNEVKKGEIIGLSGNTGYSIEPHLHFSVKIGNISVDPLKFIALTQKELK